MNIEVISLSRNRIIFHSSTIEKLMIRVELSMNKYIARSKKKKRILPNKGTLYYNKKEIIVGDEWKSSISDLFREQVDGENL